MNLSCKIEEKEAFYSKFKDKGFLSTPQLFKIAAELENEHVENKIDLYEKFIKKAISEDNIFHKEIYPKLGDNELFKIIGYLAYMYMFSNIDRFEDNILKDIAEDEKGYRLDVLEKIVLSTKLFKDKKFIHRTFAEFLAAYFFYYLIEKEDFSKILIKNK